LGILDRKVKPMIVAICISIVLNKQSVSVRFFFMIEGTQKVAAFKSGIKFERNLFESVAFRSIFSCQLIWFVLDDLKGFDGLDFGWFAISDAVKPQMIA
jgi:hypothetical protein